MTDLETPDLHQQRLIYVAEQLRATQAQDVLDLGCGSGGLLQYLLQVEQFERVVGVELDGELLAQAKFRLADLPRAKQCLELICGSYTDDKQPLKHFSAAAMVETIEHIPPAQLSALEKAVFANFRPAYLVITTPNADYNPLLGLDEGEYRDPDHKFEWSRGRFQQWARGVAKRHGYRVRFTGIGEWHDALGQPTQLAHFTHKLTEKTPSQPLGREGVAHLV